MNISLVSKYLQLSFELGRLVPFLHIILEVVLNSVGKENMLASIAKVSPPIVARNFREIQSELYRKAIHLLVAFVSLIASIDLSFTITLLGIGIIAYTYAEYLRRTGRTVFVISQLTVIASREREIGHFVYGPITLGLGAMLALMLYPHPAATVAIYALAFGDGFSSLLGKMFGRIRIPLTGGKTVVGSVTCFAAVFLVVIIMTNEPVTAVIIASSAMLFEALPTKDLDNIVLPVGTGFVASLFLTLT